MLFLLASSRSQLARRLFQTHHWGVMETSRSPKPLPGQAWALDNGAYHNRNTNGQASPLFDQHIDKIATRIQDRSLTQPLFVVAPDLIGAGTHSVTHSIHRARDINTRHPNINLHWYLPVGDGCYPEQLARTKTLFHGIFFAGSQQWKESTAAEFHHAATELGWLCHWARCSTPHNLQLAHQWRFHSGDSSAPLWNKHALENFTRAWDELYGNDNH